MSTLRSVIDQLRLSDPDDFTPDELETELIEIIRDIASLQAHLLKLVAALSREACTSTTATCRRPHG